MVDMAIWPKLITLAFLWETSNKKKPLWLALFLKGLYYCKLGLHCKSPSKEYLTVVNDKLLLKMKINSVIRSASNSFPLILISDVPYNFQCRFWNESNYRKCVRYLTVRTGGHIAILPLTNKMFRQRKDGAGYHHLLIWYYSAFVEGFSVLYYENEK